MAWFPPPVLTNFRTNFRLLAASLA